MGYEEQEEGPQTAALRHAFGVVLRELRRERGMSQECVGLATGLARNYIGLLERGDRSPALPVIWRLAIALGVRPHQLLLRVEERVQDD